MSANENGDGPQATQARQTFADLRKVLESAKRSHEGDHNNSALIAVIAGVIGHLERLARDIDDVRSDLTHKQGIVTKIGGGDF